MIKRSHIIIIITCSFVIVFIAFNRLYLSMGSYWNARILERRFSLTNSSHRYSTRPKYRPTPNISTKTKRRVPLSLFCSFAIVLARWFALRSTYHYRFSQVTKNVLDQFFSHQVCDKGSRALQILVVRSYRTRSQANQSAKHFFTSLNRPVRAKNNSLQD